MSPYPTIFAPLQWDRGEYYPLPGIDYLEYSYYDGEDVWNCPATSLIGSAEQWREGALSTDPVPEYNEDTDCPVSCGCLGSGLVFTCTHCPAGAAEVRTVTFSGLVGVMAVYNGTWALSYTSACNWNYEDASRGLNFGFNTPTQASLQCYRPPFTLDATYLGAVAISCTGPNTMPLSAGNPQFPLSITVDPGE